MKNLPQRFLDSFHEIGDRLADQTFAPIECCISPTASTTTSSDKSFIPIGAPDDMFSSSIAQLSKQLDEFLTPVPDVIVKEYDIADFEARDEEEIVAAGTNSTTEMSTPNQGMYQEEQRQLDQPPPLLEVVSMESSADNGDTVSLLDNVEGGASVESSSSDDTSSSDDDNSEEKELDPVLELSSPDSLQTISKDIQEFPEDERSELANNIKDKELEPTSTIDKDGPLETLIDHDSVPQLFFDADNTAAVINIADDKRRQAEEAEVGTVSSQHTKRSDDGTDKKYSLTDLKRHKILGEGQFGQVWLVSPIKDNEQKTYALKVLSKMNLVTEDLVDATIRERDIMLQVKGHPFIVELKSSFQDSRFIFFLEEFCQGGELFSVMHDKGRLPNEQAKFYSICIADALVFLHNHDIVFRDLKPENVMIDRNGYPKLIDFGYAKGVPVGDKTHSFCGTPRYLSPEMIAGVGHRAGVDHWALGILIYEQLTAENPFCYEGIDEPILFQSIQQDDYDVSKIDDEDALDIVQRLLEKDPRKRLGEAGSFTILEHAWFKGMDLAKLRAKLIVAPWLPKVRNLFDCCCFDDWDGLVDSKLDTDDPELSVAEQRKFRDF